MHAQWSGLIDVHLCALSLDAYMSVTDVTQSIHEWLLSNESAILLKA